MKFSFWKWFGVILVGVPVGCYTAFVAECFWNWFAVSALHLPTLSFFEMLGLWWTIQILTGQTSGSDNKHWLLVASIAELCVPAEKQGELDDLKEPNSLIVLIEGFSMVFSKIAGNTFMLAMGFALHTFIS